MSEYDEALDCQTDWASYWSSEGGRTFFHNLAVAVSRKRQEKGETQFSQMVDYKTDELRLVIAPIINGECYYWSREILDIVQLASRSLPDNWSLMKEHIPAVAGFFWFAKELEHHERALGWSVLSVDKPHGQGVAAIHIPDKQRPLPDFNAVALTTFVKNPAPDFPKPIPCRSTIYVGETLRDWKIETVRYATEIKANIEEIADSYDSIRLFAAMLSFIQQRILVPSRYSVSRATRKRVMKTRQAEPEVNAIRLRRVLHRVSKGEDQPVDWNCRWFVRGHWREQWFPSLQRNQPIFIHSYIKGPEDKPLKQSKSFFAVVR